MGQFYTELVFWTSGTRRRTFPRAMAEPSGSRAGVRSYAIVVGALAVVVAVVVFVVRAGDAARGGGAPEPALSNVDIVSIPSGATVFRAPDGGVLGTTPFTLSLPKSDKDLAVIVRADGYQDRRVTVPLFSESGRVDVTLTAIGADAAPVPPPPPDGWVP
jgi:hypothetical protein